MAIVKVGTYRNPPEDITDYEAIVAHLEAYTRQVGNQGMILTEWTNTTTAPKIAMGSYISHGGVLYVVEDEDYLLPALSVDGTYYIRVAVSGATLALDYIASLTGYVWNAIYNGLYHPDGKQVLPYQVVKSGALVEKWKITNLMQGGGFSRVRYDGVVKCESLAVTGAISGASLTGPKTVDHGNETNIVNAFAGGSLHLNYRGAVGAITELIINDGMGAGATIPIRCKSVYATDVVTTNGPNKPVDNDDNVMPDIGIGGFTFGSVNSGNITLPPFGMFMVMSYAGNSFSASNSGRKAGGAILGFTGAGMIFAWRIA